VHFFFLQGMLARLVVDKSWKGLRRETTSRCGVYIQRVISLSLSLSLSLGV